MTPATRSRISSLVGCGVTDYSRREKGEARNHHHAARYDVTDGFVGITQFDGDSATLSVATDRVLLSPSQFSALVAFVGAAKRHRRDTR